MSSKRFFIYIRYLIGIVLFGYILFQLNISNIEFDKLNIKYLILSIIPLFLFVECQGIRFNQLLFSPLKQIEITALQFKMQFFNLILPGGIGGDGYRVLLLKHENDSIKNLSFKTVIDRLSGLLLTTIMFIFALPRIVNNFEFHEEMLITAYIVSILCVVLGTIVLSRFWGGVRLWLKTISLIFYSFLCWGAQITRIWLISLSVGMSFNIKEVALILGIVQLASLLPITVGGLGVMEGAFVFAIGLLGMPHDSSVLGAILMRITTIISGLFGLVIWLYGKRHDNT